MASGTALPRVVDAVERITAQAADAAELLEGVANEVSNRLGLTAYALAVHPATRDRLGQNQPRQITGTLNLSHTGRLAPAVM